MTKQHTNTKGMSVRLLKKNKLAVCMALAITALGCSSTQQGLDNKQTQNSKPIHYQPNWQSLSQHEAAPEWFQDAKLGIYFHWGPYSVPAFGTAWYSGNMYRKGSSMNRHHEKTYGPVEEFGYEDFIPMFKAEHFDPAEWAQLFKDSGAKFAGPVAQHHDGFAMWDSQVNPWNAKDMGPKRDILGELFSELKQRDLKTIATFHHARNGQRNKHKLEKGMKDFNSHYPWYQGSPTTTNDPKLRKLFGNFETLDEFNQYWLEQVDEVVYKYSPDIIWFDSWMNMVPESYRKQMAANFFNHAQKTGQEVVTVHKHNDMPTSLSVLDFEQGGRRDLHPEPWMTDITLSQTRWMYVEGHPYKDPALVVRNMIDVWSKNGVVLLNVSPRADGVINQQQRDALKVIGDWLKTHGEAVYGTRPFDTFGYGTAGSKSSTHDGQSAKIEYTAKDARFTVSKDGKAMYVHFLGKPKPGSKVKIKALGRHRYAPRSAVQKVTMLGSDVDVKWQDDTYSFNIVMPERDLNEIATVFKLHLE
ncbi:alpha-L-fucosidase [Saccharobesus litoralis]|uniref:alpha-L-fucosidase n=1 Tax=Saccharobesus litoralis TaxID=2172099 RepID=A0A2S0VNR5_9ALTE|nr:alpha-L-fucosidase [Saccharobesus litoralis]AWB65839.1 alpha-L-fucosidase [Saccharobesus litoralis]